MNACIVDSYPHKTVLPITPTVCYHLVLRLRTDFAVDCQYLPIFWNKSVVLTKEPLPPAVSSRLNDIIGALR